MNFNILIKNLGLALTVLFTAHTYTQEILELQPVQKRTFIYRVGDKLNINIQDLTRGAIFGSALFASSFLVKDPRLKFTLRILAFAPMISIFTPKRILKKFEKLELDEAACSNFTCKGVCSDCRITKAYLAAIPLTLIPYGISWLFTKQPTSQVPAPQVSAPNTIPNAQLPTHMPEQPNQENSITPNPTAPQNNVLEPIEKISIQELHDQQPTQEIQARPTHADLIEIENDTQENSNEEEVEDWSIPREFTHEELLTTARLIRARLPADYEPTPLSDEEHNSQEEHLDEQPQENETSNWGDWLTQKAMNWFGPDIDFDYGDSNGTL